MLTWHPLLPLGQGRGGWTRRLLHARERKKEKNDRIKLHAQFTFTQRRPEPRHERAGQLAWWTLAGFMPRFQARVSPPATFEWLHLPFPLLTAWSALILPTGRRWISAAGPVWLCCWNKRLEPLSCFIHFNLALSTTNYNSWHCIASLQGQKINTAPWFSTREMHSKIRSGEGRRTKHGMEDFTFINQAGNAEHFS